MTFDITEQLEALIDAAIACEMYDAPELAGFVQTGGGFTSYNGATGQSVTLPGRHGYQGPEDTYSGALDPSVTLVNGVPATEMFAKWESRIHEMFYPFKTMPRPEDFADQISGFEPVLQRLAINPETFTVVGASGAEYLDFEVDGNDQFTLVDTASAQFALMQGLTAEAFRTYYLDRFPLVTQRQYALAQMLMVSVTGEKVMWEKLQDDVTTMVDDATAAFDERAGISIDLGVVATVLSLAALIPQAAPVAGPAATIVGALSTIPSSSSEHTYTYDLRGEDAESIWSSLEDAVAKLKELAGDQESDIGFHMSKLKGLMVTTPSDWNLNAIDDPNDPDTTSEGTELETATDASSVISDTGTMNLDFDIMITTGQNLQTVSEEFTRAASDLNGVLSSGAWSRSGGIGKGYIGHYEETADTLDVLVSVLHDTAQGLYRAGEVVQIAARRIRGEDEQANADLNQHRAQVQDVEMAEASVG